MSKLVKGIKKGFKKIFKGVKKVFKKITKSFIGKIILAAVVIYTGGVLLGVWGKAGPMSGMFGAWSGGATTTTSVAGTGVSTGVSTGGTLTAAETAAELAAINAESVALTAAQQTAASGVVEGAVTGGLTDGLISAPILGVEQAATAAKVLETAAAGETVLGSLWSGIKDVAALAEANPVSTGMLMKGVSSALTPDQPNEIDILREQDTLRRERWAGLGTFERTPRLSGRGPSTLYQQSAVPWHSKGTKGN